MYGVKANGANVFRSIPYAAPPIGAFRWENPQLPKRWILPLNVGAFPDMCPQISSHKTIGEEDCLYLYLYTSCNSSAQCKLEKKPVYVWIHGGGLQVYRKGCFFYVVISDQTLFSRFHAHHSPTLSLPSVTQVGDGYLSHNVSNGGFYDGTKLVSLYDIVLVSVQYRLGTLGFLALPTDNHTQGDVDGIWNGVGNFGLRDQR